MEDDRGASRNEVGVLLISICWASNVTPERENEGGDSSRGSRYNKQVQVSDMRGPSPFIGVEIKHKVDRYPDWINLLT